MEIAKLNYPEEFRFSMLVPPPSPNPTATEQAFYDILAAFDSLWPQISPYFQELFLGISGRHNFAGFGLSELAGDCPNPPRQGFLSDHEPVRSAQTRFQSRRPLVRTCMGCNLAREKGNGFFLDLFSRGTPRNPPVVRPGGSARARVDQRRIEPGALVPAILDRAFNGEL